MSTRQERRRQERQAKKKKVALPKASMNQDGSYDMNIRFVQPWSCPILMTRLPDNILGKMLEITDEVIEKKEQSWGQNLAGQIENELVVPHEMLKEAGVFDFFHDLVRHFVVQCKIQQMGPDSEERVHNEQWLVQMLSMWVVNQYENEYNPTHIHTQCQISSAMYLKVPKFMDSRKKHRGQDDGSICFTAPASRDVDLSNPTWSWRPQVGDCFIFGAQQLHHVYPYRVEQGDPERRCVSFNAIFSTKSDQEKFEQQQRELQKKKLNNTEHYNEVQKLLKTHKI